MLTTSQKWTALHIACEYGATFDVIKTLINLGGKELVIAKNSHFFTALHYLCLRIKNDTNIANKIKLLLEVPGTEIILTVKNKKGEIPLDYATVRRASDEIKALLQPRTIKNEPTISSNDAINLVPNDHDNDTAKRERDEEDDGGDRGQDQYDEATHSRESIPNIKREERDEVDDGDQDEATHSRGSNIKRERERDEVDDGDQDEATHSRGSIPNIKRERDEADDGGNQYQDHDYDYHYHYHYDQYNEATPSRASNRGRIRSTAHEMHSVEIDAESLTEGAACTRYAEEYQFKEEIE